MLPVIHSARRQKALVLIGFVSACICFAAIESISSDQTAFWIWWVCAAHAFAIASFLPEHRECRAHFLCSFPYNAPFLCRQSFLTIMSTWIFIPLTDLFLTHQIIVFLFTVCLSFGISLSSYCIALVFIRGLRAGPELVNHAEQAACTERLDRASVNTSISSSDRFLHRGLEPHQTRAHAGRKQIE